MNRPALLVCAAALALAVSLAAQPADPVHPPDAAASASASPSPAGAGAAASAPTVASAPVVASAASTASAASAASVAHAASAASVAQEASAAIAAAAPVASAASATTPEAFAIALAQGNNLPLPWLRAALAQARMQPRVARLIMPAPPGSSSKNWDAYRARLVDAARVQAGARWARRHATTLARAEQRWGVPPEIIAGIVGVETYYGRITGGFRTLDALYTLAFHFPSGRSDRSAFFRSELESLLVWCHREGRDPTSVQGSYAGAIGLPQFMPGSILRHAVDFDGDGHINLEVDGADVIGSVANYFANHGWQRGMPTHFRIDPPSDTRARAQLLAPDIKPTFTAAQMQALGARLEPDGQRHPGLLALVELQRGARAPMHVAGSENFYVITRYNWSAYYDMAVIDLAERIRAQQR